MNFCRRYTYQKGHKINTASKFLIIISISTSRLNCQEINDQACISCLSNDRSKCYECDDNFELNENGKCVCKKGFSLNEGKCIENLVNCETETPIIGCLKCIENSKTKCALCDTSKGFGEFPDYDNNCSCKDTEHYEISEKNECVSKSKCDSTTNVPGCSFCKDSANTCTECDIEKFQKNPVDGKCVCKIDGYVNENGNCVAPKSNCNESITINGCLLCQEDDSNKCAKCDSSLHFRVQPDEKFECTKCESHYSL